jgi:hypothetical protein
MPEPLDLPEGVDRDLFHQLMTAYSTAYRSLGKRPTASQVRKVWPKLPTTLVAEIIKTPEFQRAIVMLGADTAKGLSHEQQVVIAKLADPFDRRGVASKLKDLGTPMQRYLAWKKNPSFLAELNHQTSGAYQESLPEIRGRLLSMAADGDMKAMEIVLKKTGEYDPDAQAVDDARTLVLKVMESVMRNVRSVAEREAILADVRGYAISLSAPPREITR